MVSSASENHCKVEPVIQVADKAADSPTHILDGTEDRSVGEVGIGVTVTSVETPVLLQDPLAELIHAA